MRTGLVWPHWRPRVQDEYHRCAVPDCPASIVRTRVMCTGHWYRLPAGTRRAIGRLLRVYLAKGGAGRLAKLREAQGKAVRHLRRGGAGDRDAVLERRREPRERAG